MKLPFLSLLAVLYVPSTFAQEFYSSGTLKSFSRLESNAGEFGEPDFLQHYYGDLGKDYEFRVQQKWVDKTHSHTTYALFYRGYPIADRYVRVHTTRAGKVDYASCNLEHPIVLREFSEGRAVAEVALSVKRRILDKYRRRFQNFQGNASVTPVIWEKGGEAQIAFEVKFASQKPVIYRRHYFVGKDLETVLEERKVYRNAARDVYPIHPDRTALSTIGSFDDLSGVNLSDSFFHVYREQYPALSPVRREVDSTTNFSGDGGFTTNPATYAHTCQGTSAQCPNQGLDAVNVYYHLNQYRNHLEEYFATLGVSPSLTMDPMTVVVNTLSVDLDGDGSGADETNNAFYADTLGDADGGLFFLRPASGIASVCGSGTITFYDLAREAVVIVHEYQHYITDKITGFVAGSYETANVGDALHEGYSDYFGASQVSRLNGEDVTLVGEYAFQDCSPIQRDVGTLYPFDNSNEDFSDSHVAGLTLASGLWQLRTELGREIADLIALKSLFFYSVNPTFFEAVESLVRADQALYEGAHVERIRELFYDTLHFTGATSGAFRDSKNFVVELGFQSCGVSPVGASSGLGSGALFVVWLLSLLTLGRARGIGKRGEDKRSGGKG